MKGIVRSVSLTQCLKYLMKFSSIRSAQSLTCTSLLNGCSFFLAWSLDVAMMNFSLESHTSGAYMMNKILDSVLPSLVGYSSSNTAYLYTHQLGSAHTKGKPRYSCLDTKETRGKSIIKILPSLILGHVLLELVESGCSSTDFLNYDVGLILVDLHDKVSVCSLHSECIELSDTLISKGNACLHLYFDISLIKFIIL